MDKWAQKYGGFKDPTAKMFIDGKDIPFDGSKKGIKVLGIQVEKSVGCEASTCIVKVKWERKQDDPYTPPFMSVFKMGAKLKIDIGYNKKTSTVFVGYISSIEIDSEADNDTVVLVKGMDVKVLMMSNRRTEFIKGANTYPKAAQNVLNDYASKADGVKVKVQGAPEVKFPIGPINESDYGFLCRMAALSGALFFVDNGNVKFVSMYSEKNAKDTIEKSVISRIRMSVDLWGIPKQVEAIFQDPKHYKQTGKGAASKPDDVGKGSVASSVGKIINSKVVLVDNTASSAKEADFIAQAEQNRRNSDFVIITVYLSNGIPDLKLGTAYKIDGVGDMFDNSFIVYSIKYEIDGYGNSSSSLILKSSVLEKPKSAGVM